MKDIVAYSDKENIIAFINCQWRTDMFRSAAQTVGHPINILLDSFASKPRIFFHFSEPELEKLHFTTWMGAMALRGADWYENPYIADVFLLHEMCHMAYAEYDMNLSFEDWHEKMNMEEVYASVLSEVMVYFWLPELRQHTFSSPIWADRFLYEEIFTLYQDAPHKVEDMVMAERLRHMAPRFANDPDPEVRRIAQYGFSNYTWSNIWKDTYRDVEFRMYLFTFASMRNNYTALKDQMAWLEAHMVDGIPFRAQAEAYAAHLKEVYGH